MGLITILGCIGQVYNRQDDLIKQQYYKLIYIKLSFDMLRQNYMFLIVFAIITKLTESICPGQFWNPLNNACVDKCPWIYPNFYYADPSTNKCVLTCPTTPSLYADHWIQECVSQCPWNASDTDNQTYYDNDYRECVIDCPSSPPRYKSFDTDVRTCLKYCASGSYALDTTRQCVDICPDYYFINKTLAYTQRRCVAKCPNNTFVDQSNKHCVKSKNCPTDRYGDPTTGLCVEHCPIYNGVQLFIDDNPNRKICVYVCPDGFYQQNQNNNWTCVTECISNRWIDYVTMACVETCPNNTYAFTNGSCITRCPSSLFADPFTHKCHTECSGDYFADPTTRTCVPVCPHGYFGDITGGYKCEQICSEDTEFGNPINRLCVVKQDCPAPYLYADNHTRQCVTLCPQSQNYYGSTNVSACVLACPWDTGSSYYTYKDPSTQTCVTQCPVNPSYYRYNGTKTCVLVCPNPFFAVQSTRTCEQVCPDGFYQQPVSRKCVSTCPQDPRPQYLFINTTSDSDECVQICPLDTLADPTTMSCITDQCPSNPDLYAFNNTCIPECPEGMYKHTDTRTCDEECTGDWLMDNSTRRCVLVCPTNPALYAYDNKCISECPEDWYSDNSTRQCVQTCNASVGYIAYKPTKMCVLQCINNTYSHEGVCVETCPTDADTGTVYYIDITSASCVADCPDYYFKDDNLGSCVLSDGCSLDYYADPSIRKCVQFCNSSLSLYQDNQTMTCVDFCPYGMFADPSDPDHKQCKLTCPEGWLQDNSTWTCVEECPTFPSYYADLHLRKCVFKCRIQNNQYASDGERVCVTECPDGQFADNQTRRCLPQCLHIPSTYELSNPDGTNRTCVLTCPIGYFADNSTRKCVTGCPSLVDYYAHWESRTCVALCPATETTLWFSDTDSRSCVEQCPFLADGVTYKSFRDSLIRRCMPICSGVQFSDQSTGNCVERCPQIPDLYGQIQTKQCVAQCNPLEDIWADNITRTCVAVCPQGSYADNHTQRCVALCPVDQLYYGDPSTHRCVEKCPEFPELFADNMTQTCVHVCPNETYGTPDTRVCEAPLNCTDFHFADPYTKRCVTNCPPAQGIFANNATQKCEMQCPDGLFADNSTWSCVSVCPDDPWYFGYERECLETCPQGFYADNHTRLCLQSFDCSDNVLGKPTFGDPITQRCVSVCPFAYYADVRPQVLRCVEMCPQGWYADDYTKQCVQKCPQANKTYGTNQTNMCVQVCPFGQFAENQTRMCMYECPQGSFADYNVRVCVQTCSATPNLYGDNSTNTCVEVCPEDPDSYADNSTRLCVFDCPFSESTFADRLTRRCVLTCPVKGFTFADNITRACEEVCTYNGTYKSYADNSTLTCVTECPSDPEYYADDSTKTCVAHCPNDTNPRTFADNSTRVCEPICNISIFYYSANTTGDCLVYCPGGYFADNHTQSCVDVCPGLNESSQLVDYYGYEGDRTCKDLCPEFWFAQNSSRLCVQDCPLNQYADMHKRRCVKQCDGQQREYADNTTNTCRWPCPEVPDMYADNLSYTCVLDCPPDYWASNMTRECVDDCEPMFKDNHTGRCVWHCPNHLFTYADNLTFSCVTDCPNDTLVTPGTFADDSTKRCVAICPDEPWTFAENISRTCVYRCPQFSFGENTTRQCVENCSDWGTFADNFTATCVSQCSPNSFADNDTWQCVQECPNGTFADNSTWQCVERCPSDPMLFGDNSTWTCVKHCPDDGFGDDLTNLCVQDCPDDPLYFEYTLQRRCLQDCIYPFFGEVDIGVCVEECYVNQYRNITTHRCTICPVNCQTCQSELLCRTCVVNVTETEPISGSIVQYHYYIFNGTCVTGCLPGTLSSCVSACPTNYITGQPTYASITADPSLNLCVQTCPKAFGLYGFNTTWYCISECPINYYASDITRRCQLCINGCNNCTNATYCFSCYPGYLYSNHLCIQQCSQTLQYYLGSACVSSCPDGTFLMSDQVTCNNCSSTCATCSLKASNCTRCVGAFLYNYQCVNKCPRDFYANSDLQCVPCTDDAPQCNIQPLTYTLSTFSEGQELYGLLEFNRQVYMDTARIKQIIDLKLNGVPSNAYTWDSTRVNANTYRLNIYARVSLNEMSLSLNFINPGMVVDSQGTIIEDTSVDAPLPTYDYISPQLKEETQGVSTFSGVISYLALAILLILLFKGSYPLLLVFQVFQNIYYHYFIIIKLPYNYQSFLINLSFLNFQFLPNLFVQHVVPADFVSQATPHKFKAAIIDTTFFISSGHYFLVIGFYVLWALIVSLLQNKSLNKARKLRRFCKGVWENRLRYGGANECIWFCFMSFTLFGLWQLYDTKMSATWTYANFGVAMLSLFICVFMVYWTIKLILTYRENFDNVPKRYRFILGDDSNYPYQMPLRYIRKLCLCLFLFSAYLQLQVVGMLSANFIIFAFYVIYRPSKSRFTNYVNILIQACYISLQMVIVFYVNEVELDTDQKMTYGTAMIAFSAITIVAVTIWMIWQFLLFLYDFKFIRDVIEETRIANQVHPEDDNLKIQMGGDVGPARTELSHKDKSIKSQSEDDDDEDEPSKKFDDETVVGIQQRHEEIIHFDEKPTNLLQIPNKNEKNNTHSRFLNKKNERGGKSRIETFSDDKESASNEPRLISSRASSRMLFADFNIDDLE